MNVAAGSPSLAPTCKPLSRVFVGKPDLYHALQACLIPLLPANGSITRGLSGDGANRICSMEAE